MLKIVRGIDTKVPPWVVGFLRGAIEGAALGAMGGISLAVADVNVEDLPPGYGALLIGLAQTGIRTIEGVLDTIDPEKRRRRA